MDDYPSDVLTHTHRQHRWVRGDWQILLWLLPWVPARHRLVRNPLTPIGRWKIFDNLRRSLVAPLLLLLLLCAWTVLPGRPWAWTVAVLALVGFPIVRALAGLFRWPAAQPLLVFLRMSGEEIVTALAQSAIAISFLAYQAARMVHAIGVTLIRV